MDFVEFTGKTVDEAIENGLQALGLTKEDAEIRVLEEGKKKLFGSVKARVEIAPKSNENKAIEETPDEASEEENSPVCEGVRGDTDGQRAVAFLDGLFELLSIPATTELVSEKNKIEINVTAARTNSIIGKRGETLDAIQTLAGAVANIGREHYKRVVVDCENYRENRENTLNKLAENLAQKAIRLGKKVQLEPMNPYERRIIHAALSNREGVKTVSEGKEPNRYIVVVPDNLEDPDAPAIVARGRNDHGNRNDRRGGGRYNDRNGRSGRGGGYDRKPAGRRSAPSSGASGGTSLKNSDFFGIFLGNSGGDGEDKE